MRLHRFFIGVLMSASLGAGNVLANVLTADEPAYGDHEVAASPMILPLLPVPLPVIRGDKLLRIAYYDTVGILGERNRCSEFFGGPTFSLEVFKQFAARLSKEHLSKDIGMRMSGVLTDFMDAQSHNRYRMFEKVTVNENGPFYRKKFLDSGSSAPNIGSFQPGTKEARVLIFLHELGHLIKDPKGDWLLPNDGHDDQLSQENSRKIERACGEQILEISKNTSPVSEAKTKIPEGSN